MALLMAVGQACAQTAPPRLIVRSDDLGCARAVNQAILYTLDSGITTSIEIMVPTPWFLEGVRLMKERPQADAGIHLTLTSEWENIKWRPLTQCPSLTDENGYFFPMIYPNPNYPGQALSERPWKLAEIEQEWRAQIEMGLRHLPQISHLTAHMGCDAFAPEVKVLAKRLAAEYGLDIDPSALGVQSVRYPGPKKTSEEKKQSFMQLLESLQSGNTYLFVEHPGLDVEEMRGMFHIGYTDVAADRQGVTNIFSDPDVRQLIAKKGIQLISYRELAGR